MKAAVTTVLFLLLCALCAAIADAPPLPQDASRPDGTRRLSLVFAGDFMQHMPQVASARRGDGSFDYSPNFRHIAPWWHDADFVIGNLETTLAYADYSGYPMFASPAAFASEMKRAGVDIVTTVNNHCCDKGARGIDHTIAILDSLGLRRTGTFRDSADYAVNNTLYLEKEGIRVALLSYTYGTNGMPVPAGRIVNPIDTVRMAADIAAAEADVKILFLHWGQEYMRQPDAEQRFLARWAYDRGVDIIIGSHPHVVQPVELLCGADPTAGGVVVYSLGNFISNQSKRYTDGGINVRIDLERYRGGRVEFSVEAVPCWVYRHSDGGRAIYEVLPPQAGDTVSMDVGSRARYTQFMDDTRRLLGQTTYQFRQRNPWKSF